MSFGIYKSCIESMEHLYCVVVLYKSTSLLESRSMSNNPSLVMENRINPFMPSLGGILLGGIKCNDVDLLVSKCVRIPSSVFNIESLQQEIVHLRGLVVIATFVEEALTIAIKKTWWMT